jgi:cyclohexyl-isocyanide hydratase
MEAHNIVEVTLFTIKAEVDEADFLEADAAFAKELQAMPSFISRELLKGVGKVSLEGVRLVFVTLKQQSITAHYVTSVCTGSLILAAAGLLQGYKATCHWAFRDQLAMLGVEVVPQRVVIDRKRVTGAGVTSGIDFGLTLLGLLCREQVAKITQLMMEYTPEPPFNAGTPETAGEEVVRSLMQFGKLLLDAFQTQTYKVAAHLNA